MYQQQWGSNYQSNSPARRQAFISKVYGHLAGGFLVFALIEGLLLNSPLGAAILAMVFGFGQIGWFLLIGIFMLISWIARSQLASSPDPSKQYLGYGLYILIEVFGPISGASFNPAREFAPRLMASLVGFDAPKTIGTNWAVYLFSPVIGAVLGATITAALRSED